MPMLKTKIDLSRYANGQGTAWVAVDLPAGKGSGKGPNTLCVMMPLNQGAHDFSIRFFDQNGLQAFELGYADSEGHSVEIIAGHRRGYEDVGPRVVLTVEREGELS